MKTSKVAIVGGGLGGLALAQRLTTEGFQVQVFERDACPTARTQGFRISLDSLGHRALEELLPPERFARVADLRVRKVGSGFAFATAQLLPLFVLDGAGALTIRRPGLRKLLLEGLPVAWGKRLAELSEEGEKVRLRFEDETTFEADFVVGCDGVGSVVRERIRAAGGDSRGVPRITPNGLSTVGGYLDRTPEWDGLLPLNQHGAVQHLGSHGRYLFLSFCEQEDGRPAILWALSGRDPSRDGSWPRLGQTSSGRATLKEQCLTWMPDWSPTLRRLIEETAVDEIAEPLVIKSTQFAKKRAQTIWPSGRVTLLGDAAHAMPPQRGIGGNNALEDARLLASLAGRGTWPEVTARYEQQMFARAKKAVDDSDESAQLCHFQNPLAVFLRDSALRVLWTGARVRAAFRRPAAAGGRFISAS